MTHDIEAEARWMDNMTAKNKTEDAIPSTASFFNHLLTSILQNKK